MKKIRAFAAFWYDFVIGDDWRVAVGVILALGCTFLLARVTTIAVWWLLPVAVVLLLPTSIYRVARRPR
jgi:membrane-bound metal-dependent hydrolase YbcI (DUF457 family)